MKKIVCLMGSPRSKGNSATLARRFCETAERLDASVQTFSLNKLTYRGCQACMACKTKLDHCALKDDLADVLSAARAADILVIATPTYYGEVSSQVKAFIDRTYSFLVPDYITNPNPSRLAPGKRMVFIQTQAQPDKRQFADVFPRYDYFFNWYGFRNNILIRACGFGGPGEVETNEDLMKQAEEAARKVLE
jgi:multimeric flavodoxin WrbA